MKTKFLLFIFGLCTLTPAIADSSLKVKVSRETIVTLNGEILSNLIWASNRIVNERQGNRGRVSYGAYPLVIGNCSLGGMASNYLRLDIRGKLIDESPLAKKSSDAYHVAQRMIDEVNAGHCDL